MERRMNITTSDISWIFTSEIQEWIFSFISFFFNLSSGFVGSSQVPRPVKPGSGTRRYAEPHSSLKLPEKFPLKLLFERN